MVVRVPAVDFALARTLALYCYSTPPQETTKCTSTPSKGAKTSRVVPTCQPNEVMPTHESRLVESLAHRPEAVFEFIEQFLIFKREILEKALIMVLRCIGFFDLVLQLAQFGPGFGERLLLSNPKGSLRGAVLRFPSLCVSNARS